MKTIAVAAVFFALTATAWADEPESKDATSDEPIVLSEAEMDGVTAGAGTMLVMERSFSVGGVSPSSSTNTCLTCNKQWLSSRVISSQK